MTVYQTITVNVEPDPDAVEVRERRGEQWLVAPVVAVAEGVLNGGFLPFREIQHSAPGWNGVPLTVNHPEDDQGNFIPAADPETLEQYQIGVFLNAEADAEDRTLTGELWIRLAAVKWLVENADRLGDEAEDVVRMLREGEPLEVSTGYWHGQKQDSGSFQGVEYEAVQVDLLPDHLAVLPNAEGACNWEGTTTASGCGAPRANVRGGDSQLTFATNLLDQARTPSFEGTSSSEWSAPSLSDIASGFDWEDVSSVDDLSQEQRQQAAQLSLLGDSDADVFDELVFFPVVEPGSQNLNENALDAVLSGRGSQADISDQQLESARGVARTLLEDEFDRDLDEQGQTLGAQLSNLIETRVDADDATERADVVDEMAQQAGIDSDAVNAIIRGEITCPPLGRLEAFAEVLQVETDTLVQAARSDGCSYDRDANSRNIRERIGEAFLRTIGVDVDALAAHRDTDPTTVSYAVHAANCTCGSCTMGSNPDDDRLEAIAEHSTFSVEELESMDDETVQKIDESLDLDGQAGDGGSDGGTDGGGSDLDSNVEALVETVEEQNEKIEALESRLDEQNADRRQGLVDAITSQTRFDEDDLEDLGIAENIDKLERFAEKQGAQVQTESYFGGRAAGVEHDDDFEVEVDGYFTSQEQAEEAD